MAIKRTVLRKTRRFVATYRVWPLLLTLMIILQILQIFWMENYNILGKTKLEVVSGYMAFGKNLTANNNDNNNNNNNNKILVNKNNIVNQTLYTGKCRMMKAPWGVNIIGADSLSDMKDWGFKKKVKCEEFDISTVTKLRTKVGIDCQPQNPSLNISQTEKSSDIFTFVFGDPCLAEFIENCCIDENPVPNVVHYIWYENNELQFFHFLSLMSVIRFKKPCLILIHGPFIPYGPYWDYVIQLSPNIIHVYRQRPIQVFGNKLKFKEHSSDVMRIEALIAYGGVYLDFDEILLRPIDSLRRYVHTQAHEMPNTMGSQLVMSKKNATFLHLWYQSYKDDYKKIWAYNALWVPNTLAKKHPELIHVEGFNFTRPNWKETDKIYKENYDWRTNYGMHVYARWYKQPINLTIIRTLNTTLGAVSRHILLGNKELCKS